MSDAYWSLSKSEGVGCFLSTLKKTSLHRNEDHKKVHKSPAEWEDGAGGMGGRQMTKEE